MATPPPLTVDLFDETRYRAILQQYGLAHQASRYITDTLAHNETLPLEGVLHGLSQSRYAHHRHMALAVPPYLQHLLFDVSNQFSEAAVYYDRLIEQLLRLPYVFWVSLNYDVILDRRLSAHRPLLRLADYIDDSNRDWSLLKPHGSVNWFHSCHPCDLANPPWDLSVERTDFACEPPGAGLGQIRRESPIGSCRRYPALAAPEGPDDKLVMPKEHQRFFFAGLQQFRQIDILVVGYSGLDKEILNLIAQAKPKVRHMTVVSRDISEATQVEQRFRAAGIHPVWCETADDDFGAWVNSGGLNALVSDYDGPYTRAH